MSPLITKSGVEEVFLSHLNAEPSEDHKVFLDTIKIAQKNFMISDSKYAQVEEILRQMERFDRISNGMPANFISNETILKLHEESDDAPDMVAAYSLVGFLSKGCTYCQPITSPWARESIIDSLGNRKRCYLCMHKQFIDLMNEVFIKDQRGSLDGTLIDLMNKGYSAMHRRIVYEGDQDEIHYRHYWKWRIRKNAKRINDILLDLVAVSLWEFCEVIDRRKIKRCPYCQKFFIAKSIVRQRCYLDECAKRYQRLKKRKQREAEPDIYC
jgi:hypothetical protein